MTHAKTVQAIADASRVTAALGGGVVIVLLLDVLFPSDPSYTADGTVTRLEGDRVVVSYQDRQGGAADESFPAAQQSRALQVGQKIRVHDAPAYKMSRRIYLEGQRWQIGRLKFAGVVFLGFVVVPLAVRAALGRHIRSAKRALESGDPVGPRSLSVPPTSHATDSTSEV